LYFLCGYIFTQRLQRKQSSQRKSFVSLCISVPLWFNEFHARLIGRAGKGAQSRAKGYILFKRLFVSLKEPLTSKTMKTILFLFGALIVYTLPTFALNLSVNPPAGVEGIYEYRSAEAPYEYQKGIIELKRVEKKWTAKVTVDYQTFTAQEVKVEKNQVQFRINVDGNSVLIKLLHKGDTLTGTASSDSEGVMKITAERKKMTSKK
jgi:hypothetical protein